MEGEVEKKEGGVEKAVKLTHVEWEGVLEALEGELSDLEGAVSPEQIEILRVLIEKIKAQME